MEDLVHVPVGIIVRLILDKLGPKRVWNIFLAGRTEPFVVLGIHLVMFS